MLETEIKKLTAAVERLSTLLERGSLPVAEDNPPEGKPETETPAPDVEGSSSEATTTAPGDAEESTGPTRDDVRKVLVAVREKHGQAEAIGLLETYGGAASLPKVSEASYAEIIQAGKALL